MISDKRLLITYDTQAIARQKADYINRMGLGGAMWWELDADKPEETAGALVRTVREALGQLQRKENELGYERSSKFGLRMITPGQGVCRVRLMKQNTTI
jgi:chitinase